MVTARLYDLSDWQGRLGPARGRASMRAVPASGDPRQGQMGTSVAAERGPGQDFWYNDFCVFGVAAMSRGSPPGLFWRHPTGEEPWARSSHLSPRRSTATSPVPTTGRCTAWVEVVSACTTG